MPFELLEEISLGNIKVDIQKVYPELEDLEVTPTKEEQKFKSSKYGFNEVTVKGTEGIKVDDVLVDGVSVVENGIANIELRQAVIDILTEYGLIQSENLTEEQIQALNEMACEIDENGNLNITYNETILDINFSLENGNLIIDNNINVTFNINEIGELEVSY